MVPKADALFLHAKREQPLVTEILPVVEPLHLLGRRAEEFELHLLKLARTESEVARGDLVTERFADLPDAERHALACGALHVFEIHKYALRRFGTKKYLAGGILGDALKRLEHQVEFANAREIALAAYGAVDFLLGDKRLHVFRLHTRHVEIELFLGGIFLDKMVGAETRLAFLAVHQRVGKTAHMTRSHPGLRVHEYRRVQPDVVRAFLDELLPPRLLHIVLELDTQRAVVPCVGESAVNIRSGKHISSVFAERDDALHRLFIFFHTVLRYKK